MLANDHGAQKSVIVGRRGVRVVVWVCRKRDRDLDYIFIGKYFGFSSIAADGGMGGGQRVIVIQFR